MARISGLTLPENKRVDMALTILYGIGRNNVGDVLKKAGVDASVRVSALSADQVNKIQKVIDEIPTEGVLRQMVTENINRLKSIGCYRGQRHIKGLPSRGQRTRSNARTKRGKRKTIGAIKKEDTAKSAGGATTEDKGGKA